ncbi:uncharacterized protein LOC123920770 isoform X2 [Trifolium pratense]|uniref:uncharacterized protein LOC123920770 isoform X2 n=1 Tax=Trifolium pratense TaxID=57577 RepID=UPI001E69808B|nr:uncharacterized protein LOC123920770 isoform X2 [Trifolium pratense]
MSHVDLSYNCWFMQTTGIAGLCKQLAQVVYGNNYGFMIDFSIFLICEVFFLSLPPLSLVRSALSHLPLTLSSLFLSALSISSFTITSTQQPPPPSTNQPLVRVREWPSEKIFAGGREVPARRRSSGRESSCGVGLGIKVAIKSEFMMAPPEIYAILGEELSVEDEEEVLAEFENLETQVEAKGDSRYFKVLGICNDVFLVDMFFDKFFTDFDSSLSSSSIIVLPDFSEDPSLNDSAYSCDGQKLANDTIDYPVKEAWL